MPNSTRSDGYLADTTYVDRLHRELSPAWLRYVAVVNGVRPIDLRSPFRYLELGCGRAGSVLANAAAFPLGHFHACDLNTAHIEEARTQARKRGLENLLFHERTFSELSSDDVPACDFIVLHGVYSWVGAGARSQVRNVIRQKLRPGGLVYVSYNCLPGWSAEMPLRRLMVESVATQVGDVPSRARRAVDWMEQLREAGFRYFPSNPAAANALDAYGREPDAYLAHEFLNRTWEPFYSIDVADQIEDLGLELVGSATLADNHEVLLIDKAQAELIAGIASPRLRQLAVDFAVNRSFRRDVFSRAPDRLSAPEASAALEATGIRRADPDRPIGAQVIVPRGEIRFNEDFVRELDVLLRDREHTIGTATDTLALAGRDRTEIRRNLVFLIAADVLEPCASAS